MPRATPILAASIAALLAGCAATVDETAELPANISTERQCFMTRLINGYSEAPEGPGGQERLYIKTGVNERWLLEPVGFCPDLDWAQRIALDTRTIGSLCTGHTARLLVPSAVTGRTDNCLVRVLGKVVEPG